MPPIFHSRLVLRDLAAQDGLQCSGVCTHRRVRAAFDCRWLDQLLCDHAVCRQHHICGVSVSNALKCFSRKYSDNAVLLTALWILYTVDLIWFHRYMLHMAFGSHLMSAICVLWVRLNDHELNSGQDWKINEIWTFIGKTGIPQHTGHECVCTTGSKDKNSTDTYRRS